MHDDKGICAYLSVISHGNWAEKDGTCPNVYVISDSWMALACMLTGSSECDIVEHHAVVADLRGFADDHARPVIDKEISSDFSCWMDLHSGPETGDYR